MNDYITHLLDTLFRWLGLEHLQGVWREVAGVAVVLLVVAGLWLLLRWLLRMIARHLRGRFHSAEAAILLSEGNVSKVAAIVALMILYAALPLLFVEEGSLAKAFVKLLNVSFVLLMVGLANNAVKVLFEIFYRRRDYRNKPLKGMMQVLQIIIFVVGIILIIAIFFNRSPTKLLTGLGASAAVVSLIFKNSILGLVSGVMLSQEHMIKVGDWVEMPSHGIEGIVEEVTLNTVKIRNFDNSLSTVPPYVLTDNHLINQQAMKESGGRRVMRSLLLDVRTIRFCTPEELASLSDIPAVAQHIATLSTSHNEVTNLTLFRAYLSDYIEKMPLRHKGMLSMVRELAPTQYGLPLQIYLFLAQTEWRAFELAQADIIDHIVAIIPRFGLKIFQLSIEGAEGEG
ncbi:MAG: mechanosensitive ion channel [Tidjanibacter sp.]|nr:mechanosensitive ion channel [Tidjanibacter sp.]